MGVPFLDLVDQYRRIQPEIDAAIAGTLATAGFIGGPAVARFEAEFARFLGVPEVLGVGNGTDALEIALRALDLPAGAEVLVPANSFVATSEAVTNAGLAVRFVDVDPTYTLDPHAVRAAITRRTAAMIPVHLYGQPADLGCLREIARSHGLAVIEDCAQAHGARFAGEHVGTRADAATFSFFPGKNLGAYGDGGAVVIRDPEAMGRARMIANHGRVDKYDHLVEGRNSRLDALQAAVLSAKLPHLRAWIDHRRWAASQYRRGLAGVGDLVLPQEVPGTEHAFHLFVVRTPRRDDLRAHLVAAGIGVGVHYPIALPDLAAYQHLRGTQNDAPWASAWAGQVLSLPMGDHLTAAHIDEVVAAVRDFYGE